VTKTPRFQRVTILTQYYPPEIGAAPIRLRAMVRELRSLGCDVRVLTGMPNYPTGTIYPGYDHRLTMAERIDDVPVRRVWLYPAAGRHPVKRLLNYLSFTATSAIALAFMPPADLVFVEAQPMTLAIAAYINRLVRGTPFIYNTPDLQVEYASEDSWIGIAALIKASRALEGFLMRRALSVSTVTHAFIDHFQRERGLPRERLSFLPNGADVAQLCPRAYDQHLAGELAINGRKLFTFAGTFATYQGLELILEAAKLLRHRTDIAFAMVGDGPVRQPLMEQARREGITNVQFVPTMPLDQIPAIMSITWGALVVLRKLQLTRKMRLAKAIPPMACGVPLIYSGWGETAGIIEREQAGICIEPEDPAALAAAIERLADDRELRDAMGRRARALAEREFSWSPIVADWLAQIERIDARFSTVETG
jgi:glycosyltransferase involved in cell wall biosynthesis